MFQVKDIMTTNVVTVTPESTMRDAAGLILRHGVSGLPVTNGRRQVVGVLSEYDLLQVLESPEIESESVGDYMTCDTLCVSEETSLVDVVDLFQARRVRRLPVTRNEKLVGLVSRHDLIRFVLTTRDRIAGRENVDGSQSVKRPATKPRKREPAGGRRRAATASHAV
jgi:CBS domain-containing protein